METTAALHLAPREGAQQGPAGLLRLVGSAAASLLLFLGVGGSVWALFPVEASVPLVLGAGLLFLAGAWLVLHRARSASKALLVLLAAAGGLLLAIWALLPGGFAQVANQIFRLMTARTGRIWPQFSGAGGLPAQVLAGAFLAPVAGLLAVAAAAIAHSASLPGGFLLWAGVTALCLLAGEAPGALWLALLLPGLLVLLALRLARRPAVGEKPPRGRAVRSAIAVILAVWLLAGALVFMPVAGGQGAPALQKAIARLRYGGGTAHNLPEGDLQNLAPLQRGDAPALEVVMSSPSSLYLRGYVGSVYTGEGWEELPASSLAEDADLFYWLHQEGFYGQTQLARAAGLVDEELGADAAGLVVVNNLAASCRYAYAPYELAGADEDLLAAGAIGDVRARADGPLGQRVYRYATLPNQVKRYPELVMALYEAEQVPSEELQTYLVQESHYNRFVYSRFLQLPQADAAYLAQELGPVDFGGQPHLPYQQAKQAVLAFLTERLRYNEEAGGTPITNGDFLARLLGESGEGYAVQYATAAALLFRYYGIPARYVEGFLITPGDVEGLLGGTAITLDGTHAHAWVEIYQDGIGWVPFETCPPYLSVMEQADMLDGVDVGQAGQQNSTAGASEMEMDNYEEEAPEMPEVETPAWMALILRMAAVAAALAGLVALLMWQTRGRRRVKRRRAACTAPDNNDAVKSMFEYTQLLLAQLGFHDLQRTPYSYREVSRSKKRYAPYEKIVAIYNEACYSTHTVTRKQRRSVRKFLKRVHTDVMVKASVPRWLYLRYIRFVW